MKISNDKIKKIIECHKTGLSVRKIAKKTQISKNTVQKYIMKYKNNALTQMSIFPERNLYTTVHTSASHQKKQEFILPQMHYGYYNSVGPLFFDPYSRNNIKENKFQEQEKKRGEQREKSYQEENERFRQYKMECYSLIQTLKRQKQQNKIDLRKSTQERREYKEEKHQKKINPEIRILEEMLQEKQQQIQQSNNSNKKLIREELEWDKTSKKVSKNVILRKIDQNHQPAPIVLNPVEKRINTESYDSDVLYGVIDGFLQAMPKLVNQILSHQNNIPKNSSKYWLRPIKKTIKDKKNET